MKRFLAYLLILALFLTGCGSDTIKSNNMSSNYKDLKPIEYYTIYSNFLTYTDMSEFPKEGIYVFKNDKEWNEFKKEHFEDVVFLSNNQFPNISLDTTDKNLICVVIYPPKPTYVPQFYIKNIKVNNKYLYIYTDTTGIVKQTSGIDENTIYVILVTIKKEIITNNIISRLE
ncbi:hypothetical protein BVF91_00385 [Thermoanaerobacterium sp. PSU-2]|uniref:hypothetical protein n=1 Tax=Thermoanaerobacterium sp. PSU-2 TaxID=1930849 RepID=UPI000A155447|nr:hypothetical protein [Thermoanaerobacterium sp. PSU-2]ORX24383.1 hypothetical protein BVF91_00385 [Thermoanaerobacterium sp. PSU-2]